jgi:hypothetical protein
MIGSNIAKVLRHDYKQTGSDQIICVTTDGHVKGYSLNFQIKNQTNENVFVQNNEDLDEIYKDLLKKKEVDNFLLLFISFQINFLESVY